MTAREVGHLLLRDDLLVRLDGLTTWTNAVDIFEHAQGAWEETSLQQGDHPGAHLTTRVALDDDFDARISYRSKASGSRTVRVEINSGHLLPRDHRRPLLPLDDMLGLVAQAWDEARQLVDISTPQTEVRVSRIDITQDFAPVESVTQILTIANATHVPYKKHRRYQTPGGIETVEIGTKSGATLQLYDKSRQSHLAQPTARVELKLQGRDLKAHGLVHIGGLSETGLRRAFQHFVAPVASSLTAAPVGLLCDHGFKPRLVAEAFGALALQERGIPLQFGRERLAQHRRILAGLGISSTVDANP